MKRGEVAVRSLLIAPLFVYAAVVGLVAVHPIDAVLVLGVAVAAVPLAPLMLGRRVGVVFALAPATLALVGVYSFLSGASFVGRVASLDAGVLLGSPLWFLAVVLEAREAPGTSIFGLVAGATVGLLLLAAASRLAAAPTHGPTAFLDAIGAVLHDQGSALAALLAGSVPGSIPLSRVSDPVFTVLAVVALIGLIAPWLSGPAIDALLSTPVEGVAAPSDGPTSPIDLPERQDRRLDEGSSASDPPGPTWFTTIPLVACAVAGLAFVVLADRLPIYTLLAVSVGAVATTFVLALIYLGRGALRARRLGGTKTAAPFPK
ncbi:MAG: hypothetical protein ACREDK_05990 [Thermoplasmata archaeon]